MRIVCPKCELKGQVDVLTTSAKTRIACVRCATTFDAVFTDGQIRNFLPHPAPAVTALERVSDDYTAAPEAASPVIETQQELQLDLAPQLESAPAPTDDFLSLSTYVAEEETLETSSHDSLQDAPQDLLQDASQDAPQDTSQESLQESSQESSQEAATEFAWPGAETQETLVESEAVSVVETPLKAVHASKFGQPSDAYGLGVRLMQVSPMWLLIAGLSFISFIVLCNWLIKPDAPTGDMARTLVASNNHATNQSPNRVVVPGSTAQSTVNSQPTQPQSKSGASFIPAEATETNAPTTSAPDAGTIERPAVADKAAVPASSSNQANEVKASSEAKPSDEAKAGGEAKAGKVTIQIGSYNEAAQADERVANLKSAGYEAQSVAVTIPKRGTWYRVQSGRFVSRDDAERYGKQLRERGIVSNFITADVQE